MPKTLKAYLLGHPMIYLDNERINFPFSKINALIYYLLINETASRDEVAALLWPDKNETSAKKNLRNTIYQANKTLGEEYIVSLANQILALNPELSVMRDVDHLLQEDAFDAEVYRGEFLHNFYIKGCDSYDLWINKTRSYYEKKFTDKLYDKVQKDIASRQFEAVERNIQQLILIDEYDENYYQLLMHYYHIRCMHSKVIETYMQLSDLLNNELGISPSKETYDLYKQTISEVQQSQKRSRKKLPVVYYSRPNEVAAYEQIMDHFMTGVCSHVLMIEGETGNGKTEFVERMQQINQHQVQHISLRAEKIYAKNAGYIWDKLLQKMDQLIEEHPVRKELKYRNIRPSNEKEVSFDQITTIFNQLKTKLDGQKMVVTIDQFEQIDLASFKIINQLVIGFRLPLLFVCIGNGQWTPEIQQIIDHLSYEHYCNTISINALDAEETEHFIYQLIGEGEAMSAEEKALVYRLSGGNLLFIHEMVALYHQKKPMNQLTDKMKMSIEKQCSFLTQEAIEVLETLSFFNDSVSVSLLSSLIGLSSIQLKRELQELFRRNLIEEVQQEGKVVTIQIKADRIRFYFYSRQNQTIKRLMHSKIADTLIDNTATYMSDLQTLNQIAYHYRQADRKLEALEYELTFLQKDLKFKHELFPVYSQDQTQMTPTIDFTQEKAEEKMLEIQAELDQMSERYEIDLAFLKIQLKFLYIQGRYMIRIGDYEKGIENILSVIVKAKEIKANDYLLRAYLQMIYYCIQIDNADEMAHYIDFAFELAIEMNDHESIGIILRLRGLHAIMIGEVDVAEKYLQDSIRMLTINPTLENKYAINIAAVYDYLSEIALIREDYEESVALQHQALDYIKGKNNDSSEVVFAIDMGIAQYATTAYETAQTYFERALCLSEHAQFVWRRPQLLAFLAVNSFRLNRVSDALRYIRECEETVYTNSRPHSRDLGILNWAKTMLAELADERAINLPMSEYFDTDLAPYYRQEALDQLSIHRDVYERRLINRV